MVVFLRVNQLLLVLILGVVAAQGTTQPVTYLAASKSDKSKEEKSETTNTNHNLFPYINQQKESQPQNNVNSPNSFFVLGKHPQHGNHFYPPTPIYIPPSSNVHRQIQAPSSTPSPIPIFLAPQLKPALQPPPQIFPIYLAPATKEKPTNTEGLSHNVLPVVLSPSSIKKPSNQLTAAPVPQGFQIFIPTHLYPPKLGDFPFDNKPKLFNIPFHSGSVPQVPVHLPPHYKEAQQPLVAVPIQIIPGSHYGGGAFIAPKVKIPTAKQQKPIALLPYHHQLPSPHISTPFLPNYLHHDRFKPSPFYDDDFSDLRF